MISAYFLFDLIYMTSCNCFCVCVDVRDVSQCLVLKKPKKSLLSPGMKLFTDLLISSSLFMHHMTFSQRIFFCCFYYRHSVSRKIIGKSCYDYAVSLTTVEKTLICWILDLSVIKHSISVQSQNTSAFLLCWSKSDLWHMRLGSNHI